MPTKDDLDEKDAPLATLAKAQIRKGYHYVVVVVVVDILAVEEESLCCSSSCCLLATNPYFPSVNNALPSMSECLNLELYACKLKREKEGKRGRIF